MNSQKDLDQFEAIARTIVGLYESAEMIYKSHLFGYPGTVTADIAIYMKRNIQLLKDLNKHVSDMDITTLISHITESVQLLLMTDKNMKSWLEKFTGQSISRIRKSTGLSIQKRDNLGRFTGDASLPSWTKEQEYKVLINESSSIMKSLLNQVDVFFNHVGKISNGNIKNWTEEQRKKGRFQYIS